MNDKEIRLLTVLKRHMKEINDEGYDSRKEIISYIIENLKFINEIEIAERISFLVDSANNLATAIEMININLDSNIGENYINSLTITDILILQYNYLQLLVKYKSLLFTNNINKLVENSDNICIGRPFLNTKIYIMNNTDNILPIKTQGEIVIQGDGVGKGLPRVPLPHPLRAAFFGYVSGKMPGRRGEILPGDAWSGPGFGGPFYRDPAGGDSSGWPSSPTGVWRGARRSISGQYFPGHCQRGTGNSPGARVSGFEPLPGAGL